MAYLTKYEIPYEEALTCLQSDNNFTYMDYGGYLGNRMLTHFVKGNKCAYCHIPITHIAVQKHRSQPKGKYH